MIVTKKYCGELTIMGFESLKHVERMKNQIYRLISLAVQP